MWNYKYKNLISKYTIIYLAISIIIGIVLGTRLDSINYFYIVFIVDIILLIVLLKFNKNFCIALCILFLLIGLISAYTQYNNNDLPEQGIVNVQGEIYGEVKVKDNKISFILNDTSINNGGKHFKSYCTYYINKTQKIPSISNGDIISFNANLYYPKENQSKYGFNFKMYLRQKNIDFGLYSLNNIKVLARNQYLFTGDIAYGIRVRLYTLLQPLLKETSDIASAIAFGYKDQISVEERELFSELGIAHVFSVSGLHVGIIAFILLKLLSEIRLSIKKKPIIALIVLGAYTWITGFSPATIRTLVMTISLLISRIVKRYNDPIASISFAAIVVLIYNPLLIYSIGFIFSFLATLGIIIITPRLRKHLLINQNNAHESKLVSLLNHIINIFCVSFGAQIGILLPMCKYFGYISLLGIIINIFIIPFIALIVPFIFLTLAVSFIPLVNLIIGSITRALCLFLLQIIELSNKLPIKIVSAFIPTWITFFCFPLLIIVIMHGIFNISNKKRIILSVLLAICIIISPILIQPTNVKYIQLNVGQADCAVIIDGNKTIVIDTGETGEELSKLLRTYHRNIDYLFISHLHSDHVGGLKALMKDNIKISKILLSPDAEYAVVDETANILLEEVSKKGTDISKIQYGDTFYFNKSKISVCFPLYSYVHKNKDANLTSLALLFETNNIKLISCGDLPSTYEKYINENADILKISHHGSKTSTSQKFLDIINPSVALITSGINNKYLPSIETIGILRNNGIDVYRSNEYGDITIDFYKNKFILHTFLNGGNL